MRQNLAQPRSSLKTQRKPVFWRIGGSGEARWEERIPASTSICYADKRLYLHLENGDLMLVESSPQGFREYGRFSPPNLPDRGRAKAWAYPVIANGRLYNSRFRNTRLL